MWLCPREMFKFYSRVGHILFAGNISFEIIPKWDELCNASDLFQLHQFRALQLLDLDDTLKSTAVPNCDYIAKLN